MQHPATTSNNTLELQAAKGWVVEHKGRAYAPACKSVQLLRRGRLARSRHSTRRNTAEYGTGECLNEALPRPYR